LISTNQSIFKSKNKSASKVAITQIDKNNKPSIDDPAIEISNFIQNNDND
jgi:hypothetical protein